MIELFLSFFLFASAAQMQEKFNYCKKIEFKGEYCKLQKKLDGLDDFSLRKRDK